MSLLRSPKKQPAPLQLPDASTSLLIPANPALVNPGSSPTSRGGILLNPLGADKDSGSHLRDRSKSPSGSAAGGRGRWLSRTASSLSNASIKTASTAQPSNASSSSLKSSSASSTGSGSNAAGGGGTTESTAGTSLASAPSPSLKFAPLPESGRKRSSSIALGVASRAAMLQGVNQVNTQSSFSTQHPPAPHWQQQCVPVKQTWYNGGPMPDNVKTVKDIKPGLKKAWGKIRRGSSASRGSGDDASSSSQTRSDSLSSSVSTTADTASDMSAADERSVALGSSVSDTSSMISDTSIEEEDESALVFEDEEQEATRGRPGGRTSPVHLHGGASYSHSYANPQYGTSAISSSPEHQSHFMGGSASGEATPRRRHSPTGHAPHMRYGRSQPASGENTPRRRMSLSDVPAADGEQARAVAHSQAVFGFDEKLLNSRFDKLGLQRLGSKEGSEPAQGEELESSISRESENSVDESDVPIPDSNQVEGAAKEIAV